ALLPVGVTAPEADQQVPSRAFRELLTGTWVGPFPMAAVNTRVVHRSNALTGWRYGRGLRYREVIATGTGPGGRRRAQALALGVEAATAAMALPPTRWLA